MKFDHRVKFNGILYEIGQDVPTEENKAVEKANTKPQAVAKKEAVDDFSQYMNEPEIKEESAGVKYTKTEINRMSTAELKEVAKLNGVNDADDMTGGELKKVLIEKFGL